MALVFIWKKYTIGSQNGSKEKRGFDRAVKLIKDMHDEVRTSLKCVCGKTENFTVKVGVHKGSKLSP